MRPGDDPHDDFRPRGLSTEPTFGLPEELQADPPEPPNPRVFAVAAGVVLAILLIIWWL
jgi:hypothetical protein